MRLDKFLCKSTALSRSEATEQILAGRILVNGEVITAPSAQVHENNHISLEDGQRLAPLVISCCINLLIR